jgi:hypothetical protein
MLQVMPKFAAHFVSTATFVGPLWIDVFIRGNYTTDTNAFFVHVLNEIAEAEIFLLNYDKASYPSVEHLDHARKMLSTASNTTKNYSKFC